MMGSLTAYEFTEDDKRLLAQVATRAATAIVQHQLRSALDEERESFVNVLAHDLKSPLTTIRGLSYLGIRHADAKGDRHTGERFRKIDHQVDHMVRLLDDLLDARLLAAGKLSIRREPLDYCALVHEAVEEAQAATRTHRIRVKACASAAVHADRTRLVQILGNLLGNAIKYSPEGGTIVVTVKVDGGEVRTSIRDRGVGIAADQLERIFGRYKRAKSGSKVASGHGLGLSIARHLVRAHGGRIWAESAPGKGSTFHFTLPIAGAPRKRSRATPRRRRSRR
jgi:signal transduction histidine kinase